MVVFFETPAISQATNVSLSHRILMSTEIFLCLPAHIRGRSRASGLIITRIRIVFSLMALTWFSSSVVRNFGSLTTSGSRTIHSFSKVHALPSSLVLTDKSPDIVGTLEGEDFLGKSILDTPLFCCRVESQQFHTQRREQRHDWREPSRDLPKLPSGAAFITSSLATQEG